jgi:hypothetical protein
VVTWLLVVVTCHDCGDVVLTWHACGDVAACGGDVACL